MKRVWKMNVEICDVTRKCSIWCERARGDECELCGKTSCTFRVIGDKFVWRERLGLILTNLFPRVYLTCVIYCREPSQVSEQSSIAVGERAGHEQRWFRGQAVCRANFREAGASCGPSLAKLCPQGTAHWHKYCY